MKRAMRNPLGMETEETPRGDRERPKPLRMEKKLKVMEVAKNTEIGLINLSTMETRQ